MELSDKGFRVIMLSTFKKIRGKTDGEGLSVCLQHKTENLGRELEIIKNIVGLELQ